LAVDTNLAILVLVEEDTDNVVGGSVVKGAHGLKQVLAFLAAKRKVFLPLIRKRVEDGHRVPVPHTQVLCIANELLEGLVVVMDHLAFKESLRLQIHRFASVALLCRNVFSQVQLYFKICLTVLQRGSTPQFILAQIDLFETQMDFREFYSLRQVSGGFFAGKHEFVFPIKVDVL